MYNDSHSIFGDIGDYKPDLKAKTKAGGKPGSEAYFGRQAEESGDSGEWSTMCVHVPLVACTFRLLLTM